MTSSSPALDAEVLLCHVLCHHFSLSERKGETKRGWLYANPNYNLTTKQFNKFKKIISKRRHWWPIAYLTGRKEFYSRSFLVNRSTLIPRPETEGLVELALNQLKQNYKLEAKSYKLLDLGTGSGCIIITLGKELERYGHFRFLASDVSRSALTTAAKNAQIHQVGVTFFKSNLFENIPEKFDLIVANLPYLTASEYQSNYNELRFEPKQALTDGSEDFAIFQNFFLQAVKKLTPKGIMLLEISPRLTFLLRRWQKKYLPRKQIKFLPDLQNLWRYAEISSEPLLTPWSPAGGSRRE